MRAVTKIFVPCASAVTLSNINIEVASRIEIDQKTVKPYSNRGNRAIRLLSCHLSLTSDLQRLKIEKHPSHPSQFTR